MFVSMFMEEVTAPLIIARLHRTDECVYVRSYMYTCFRLCPYDTGQQGMYLYWIYGAQNTMKVCLSPETYPEQCWIFINPLRPIDQTGYICK